MGAGADDAYAVTYLEMRARPERARPRAPMLRALSLMRAEDPPLHFFRYLYDAVGRDYGWTDMHAVADDQLAAFARDPEVELWVAYLTGWPAGFAMLDRRPVDIRPEGVTDLAYFGLAPEAIGRGIGNWLLGTAIHAAWDREPTALTVNTCSLDHPRALPLYQKWGFEPVRRETRTRAPIGG